MNPGPPVLLYTLAGCRYCDAKRSELLRRGVTLHEVDVGARPETIPELLKLTRGQRIVPVIVAGGKVEIAPDGGSPI
ncbi:MAG TPA: glutaredoxin family protein [Candidatus Nitrosopolaris sp.]|nr:glutaredoxin family protein [Candidatus Nitrosopolaris sp.]